MGKNHISRVLSFCNKLYNELETINTIIIITYNYYFDKELSGHYYEMPAEFSIRISEERSHCINILSLLIKKTEEIKNICEEMEEHLHDNADDCC